MTTETQTEPMLAYLNDPTLKAQALVKIKAHRAADQIAKGAYVGAGVKPTHCAVGCLLEDPDGGHMRYESEFGIPAQLAYLEDGIFESLPDELAIPWPERFMGAITVGADLSKVWPQFAIWLTVDEKWGLVNIAETEEAKDICRRVADGYQHDIDGSPLSDADVEALAWDARAAWDARDARDARAARAAWAARDARDARAAWDAWDEWAARAARDARAAWAFTEASADKLIELLEAA